MGSSYYGRRDVVPWWPRPWRRLEQIRATLHCGRWGHEYGERQVLVEGRGPGAQVGSVRWCSHGCGCAIVEVSHR